MGATRTSTKAAPSQELCSDGGRPSMERTCETESGGDREALVGLPRASQNRVLVGIDPGAKTGIAIYLDGKLASLETLHPWEIHKMLEMWKPVVVFEDSRMISYVYTTTMSRPAALKMARNVGEIDAWCKMIEAICSELELECIGVSPKGKGAKVDAAYFGKLTGWTFPSNEHTRDAAMVAWPYRGMK